MDLVTKPQQDLFNFLLFNYSFYFLKYLMLNLILFLGLFMWDSLPNNLNFS